MFGGSVDGVDPMRPDALSRWWTAARGTLPITFLDLLHFVATTMLDAGESYRTVADILGNSEGSLRLVECVDSHCWALIRLSKQVGYGYGAPADQDLATRWTVGSPVLGP